jgi:hypothetical protein
MGGWSSSATTTTYDLDTAHFMGDHNEQMALPPDVENRMVDLILRGAASVMEKNKD